MKAPTWLRVAEIGLGAICIGTSFTVLANPAFTIESIITLVSLAFLFVGISRVIDGIVVKSIRRISRVINVGIGALAIGISIIAIAYPIVAAQLLIIFISFALLGFGAGNIAVGASSKSSSKGDCILHVVVGVLTTAFSVTVIMLPGLAMSTTVFFLSVALIITGIGSIISGIEGERRFRGIPTLK